MITGFRKYAVYAVFLLLAICILLAYVAKTNIEEFREQQITLAGNAARNTENLLQHYISELRRSVDLFANDNRREILAVLDTETRYRAHATLQQRLHRQLPDAIAFTLADTAGYPLLEDDENVIGDACREYIRLFASDPVGAAARLRIHADNFNGHFDIITTAPISADTEAILLVTFEARKIALYLQHLQPPDHSLFLLKTGSEARIEVATPESYQRPPELTAPETSRVLFTEHVDGTEWDVVDVIEFGLIEQEKWRIIKQTAFMFIAFMFGGVFSVAAIRCRMDLKRGVSTELEPYRKKLEEQIRNRTVALEAANERLQHLSLSDGLTGIANRRHFDHVLARELRRALRESMPLSLLLIDIDYFKKYNDAVGHLAGDDALKKIAHAIQNEFKRGADLAARYGGEEFAVILPSATGKEAFQQAERVRRIVDRLNIKHPDSDIADHVTISVGVTSLGTDQYKTTDELIDEADTALYRSKSEGRNRSSAFQP